MEVSKLTISDELLHQTDVKTAVLVWLKAHPKAGYNTNCMLLAKTMSLSKDFTATSSTGSIDQAIRRLITMGLIIRHRINFRRADFMVNYGHPDMPPFINEGVVKETRKPAEPLVSANEIFRINGNKTIAQLIVDWLKAHPMACVNTTTGELADLIAKDGAFHTTKESAQTVIARMIREGRIKKYKVDDKPRGKADFKVADVVYEEPEVEYEIKDDITPEEESEVTEEALDESLREIAKEEGPFFDGDKSKILHDAIEQTDFNSLIKPVEEPKEESTSTTQTIALPGGGTINLTININIGK